MNADDVKRQAEILRRKYRHTIPLKEWIGGKHVDDGARPFGGHQAEAADMELESLAERKSAEILEATIRRVRPLVEWLRAEIDGIGCCPLCDAQELADGGEHCYPCPAPAILDMALPPLVLHDDGALAAEYMSRMADDGWCVVLKALPDVYGWLVGLPGENPASLPQRAGLPRVWSVEFEDADHLRKLKPYRGRGFALGATPLAALVKAREDIAGRGPK